MTLKASGANDVISPTSLLKLPTIGDKGKAVKGNSFDETIQ